MTTSGSASPLRDPAFMGAFLDLVIPPSGDGRMPGAGSLGVESSLADAIDADPRSGAAVVAGLRAVHETAHARDAGGFTALAPADRLAVVDSLLPSHPGLMPSLLRHLYPAYYQHPRVLEALGEPARPPFPEGFEVEPTDPELLAKLIARRR